MFKAFSDKPDLILLHNYHVKENTMQIITSLFLENNDEFFSRFEELQNSPCDWIEVRIDRYYPDHALLPTNQLLMRLNRQSIKPVLFTLRTDQDPSLCSDEQYTYLLKVMDKNGFFYDIEFNRLPALDFTPDYSRVFLSYHDYEAGWKYDEVCRIARDICSYQPKVVKLALAAADFNQAMDVVECGESLEVQSEKCFLAMEPEGLVTRLIPGFFGFDYTFCASTQATASGQVSLEQMVRFETLIRGKNTKDKAVK